MRLSEAEWMTLERVAAHHGRTVAGTIRLLAEREDEMLRMLETGRREVLLTLWGGHEVGVKDLAKVTTGGEETRAQQMLDDLEVAGAVHKGKHGGYLITSKGAKMVGRPPT